MSQATAPSGPTSRSQYEALHMADVDTPNNNAGKLSEKSPIHLAANILKLKDVGRKAQKRHFYSEILKFSRARTVVALSKAGTKCRPQADGSPPAPACIPDKTPSFKMVGEFNNYNPGHYVVHWRIKTLQNFSVPNGLHFVVNVSYDAEPDLSGTLDVILPADRLKSLANNRWYNLVLDEKLVIQPHQNVARIQAILCNNENIDRHEYCGFLIDYVEIRPIALAPEKNPGITDIYVSRPATPRFTIDTAKAWPKVSQDPSYNPSSAPITRLATSKNSRYVASLAQSQDLAYISVWDMGAVRNMMHPPKNLGKLYKNCATILIRHPNVGNLPLGLALSANADQVVVYQEPMIGDWADGSKVEKASFPFRLYNNPLVPQTSFVVNIDSASSSSVYEKNEASVDGKPNRRKQGGQSTSTPETPSETIELELVPWEHELLKVFIGFAAFLPESKKGDWEKDDINTTLAGNTDADDGDAGEGKDVKEKIRVPGNTMFVTCNGIYLDVFRISPEKKWKRIHTITLTDLLPTLSRRITCKMMMESISTNVFMWLEDGGRSCTIWDLFKGSNITHISSVEGGRFKGSSFRGHCKMAISPHESIVALASADGSLTTYFANTGMAIDDRKFPGYKIEYIAFHAQDDQLFVILRSSVTYELSARVLDTLQLKSEVAASLVPIPVIGSTILAFFNLKGFWNRSVVCEPDGSKINCYIAYQPSSSKKLNKQSKTVIKTDPDDDVYESSLNGHIQYRLMTAFHYELLPDGDGVSYWVLRVEVFEENLRTKTQRIIFSFVPEPWMRITTSDVVHPENLQSIFFVPCGTRFAVVGMQTLQIWNLPTSDNAKCTLQFIWSQPKDDKEFMFGGTAYKSPRVRDYYMDISSASIYMDIETGSTTAEIKMNDKSKKRVIPLPGPRTLGARFAILFCFRSIHLLAAAYAFSHQESNRATREWTFTFEEHAEAIARFAREHINRMMSSGVYAPQSKAPRTNSKQPPRPKAKQRQVASGRNNDAPPAALETMEPHTIISAPISEDHFHIHDLGDLSDSDSSSDDEDGSRSKEGKPAPIPIIRPKVVTLLTLLLDEPYLQQTNHIFVGGLLNTANGDWIPRDNVALNPIKRVIEARNAPLLEAFIDYCIKNAKKYHPSYMMPAVQCLNLLSVRYPNILTDMFKRASYVPVHNHAYVASHAVVANPQRLRWLKSRLTFWNYGKFEKSNNINDYSRPVFSLRSQLPFRASSFLNILNIETSVRDTREDDFPAKPEVDEDKKNMPTRYSHKIYVAPFPKLSMYGPYRPFRPWLKDSYWLGGPSSNSAFIDIAGQEFFGSPAMVATLEFKWHKYGFSYWLMRFMVVLTYFVLLMLVTAMQIDASSRRNALDDSGNDVPSPEDIVSRYLVGWQPAFQVAIAFGFVLILYELMQFFSSPRKYLRSPYNYMDLLAYITPVVGCFWYLQAKVGTLHPQLGKDVGPSQVWSMSYGILFLYLNILFELRVIKQLGIVVNIILNITRSITWFFLIFGLFLISFTHALLHLLHTRRYIPCVNGQPEDCSPDLPDEFPLNAGAALTSTYFFLAGRFEPIEGSLDKGSSSLRVMMVIFFFFTSILLLNVLIALMNDAYNESKDQGQLAWLKQWSEVIAEVEIFLMSQSTRQNRNFFPDYIYYGANEQDAELYDSQFYISNRSNLSIENQFLSDRFDATQSTQRNISREVQTFGRELERVKQSQEGFTQDISKLTRVVASYLEKTTTIGPDSRPESDYQWQSSVENDPPVSGTSRRTYSDSGTLGSSTPSTPATPVAPVPPFPLPTRASRSSSSSAPGYVDTPPKTKTAKKPMLPASVRSKVSATAVDTESPTVLSPTVHFNSPQSSTAASLSLASAGVQRPLTGGEPATMTPDRELTGELSSSTAPVLPPQRNVELVDRERALRGKASSSSLKRRLPLKLAVVHTMDDALRAHRRLQNHDASHPVYVEPAGKRRVADEDGLYDSDSDDDDDGDNEEEREGEGEDRSKKTIVPVHHAHRFLPRQQTEAISLHPHETLESQQPERSPLRRSVSEAVLTDVPHEAVPFHVHPANPPGREDSSSTADL